MRFTYVSIIAIMFVVIAVAIAGCSSTGPAAPSTGGAPSSGSSAPAGSSTLAAGSSIGGGQLFGGLTYNWVEYKMTVSGQNMVIYMKWDKNGKCTMRFEGAPQMQGMPTEMDCSSSGGQAQSNPNQARSDVQFTKVGTEPVTVPAGTFTADKYTTTVQGSTSTFWIVNGKPLIKMVGGNAKDSATMELNGWG